MPYLSALSTFRDQVRKLAIAKADPAEILELTDRLRDYEMAELGVALDDQSGAFTPPPPSSLFPGTWADLLLMLLRRSSARQARPGRDPHLRPRDQARPPRPKGLPSRRLQSRGPPKGPRQDG